MGELFDRVGQGEGVGEVDMKRLLMDPVAVDWLDSLSCYTLPVSPHTHNCTFPHFFSAKAKMNFFAIIAIFPLLIKDLQAVLRAKSAEQTAE